MAMPLKTSDSVTIQNCIMQEYPHLPAREQARLSTLRTHGKAVLPGEVASFNDDMATAIALSIGAPIQNPSRRALQLTEGGPDLAGFVHRWWQGLGLNFDSYDRKVPIRGAWRTHRSDRKRAEVQLSGSAGDFPSLLADVLEKSIRASVGNYKPTSDLWTVKVSAKTRNSFHRLMSDSPNTLALIVEGESYPRVVRDVDANAPATSISKFGEIVSLGWMTLYGDDLEFLADVAKRYAGIEGKIRDSLVYELLTSNANTNDGNPLFSTAHANTITGTITAATVGTAAGKLAAQTTVGSKSERMNLRPAFLLVPQALAQTAGAVLRDSRLDDDFDIQRVVDGRLDASSITQWYLIANHKMTDTCVVGHREGLESATFERKWNFDDDSVDFKVRYEVGVTIPDYRAFVRSSGS